MGVGVRLDAPVFARHPFSLPDDYADGMPVSSWMEDEAEFAVAPRFLITTYVPDGPGLLRAMLTAFDEGIQLPDRGQASGLTLEQRRIRFSLDGSLSSSLRGGFMMATVVRAIIDPTLLALQPDLLQGASELIRDRIADELGRIGSPEWAVGNIKVEPFQNLETQLFKGLRFMEYRFGVGAGARQRALLSTVTREFADALGAAGHPIAYLYFPDDDADDSAENWLRVAVGAPGRAVESLGIDLIANEIAERHSCVIVKYDPMRAGEPTSSTFSIIGNYRDPTLSVEVVPEESPEHVDLVFAQGPARTGLVGEILSDVSAGIEAGSMTVLLGHTLSSWIVPRGRGNAFAERLRDRNQPGVTGELTVGKFATQSSSTPGSGHGYWLDWQSVDTPGVARRIIEVLSSTVHERYGVLPDIRYSISRVLASDRTCAGKFKFRVGVATELDDDALAELRDAVSQSFAVFDGSPGNGPTIIVRRDDPVEEPWASRLVW